MEKKDTRLDIDSRPHAIALAQKIGLIANASKDHRPIEFAVNIAEITLQNVVVSALVEGYEPGSQKGQEAIEQMYEAMKKTAVARWHKDDLKKHFGSN